MSRKRFTAIEEWTDESDFDAPVSVNVELENRTCVNYVRRFICPRCGGEMVERVADWKTEQTSDVSPTWVIDSWCENCHDGRTWEGAPFPNFKSDVCEGGTRCESSITLIGRLVWLGRTLPMWSRQDQAKKENETKTGYEHRIVGDAAKSLGLQEALN